MLADKVKNESEEMNLNINQDQEKIKAFNKQQFMTKCTIRVLQ